MRKAISVSYLFCACIGECLLKDADQNFQKKLYLPWFWNLGPGGHLNLILVETSKLNFMLFMSQVSEYRSEKFTPIN